MDLIGWGLGAVGILLSIGYGVQGNRRAASAHTARKASEDRAAVRLVLLSLPRIESSAKLCDVTAEAGNLGALGESLATWLHTAAEVRALVGNLPGSRSAEATEFLHSLSKAQQQARTTCDALRRGTSDDSLRARKAIARTLEAATALRTVLTAQLDRGDVDVP